jgi:hypothetical protein
VSVPAPAATAQSITFLGRPDFDTTVVYQRYYLLGLEAVTRVSVRGVPVLVRPVRGAAAKAQAIRRLTERRLLRGGVSDSGLVGRYAAGDGTRFAIDARDSHPLRDEDVLDWSDLYFKANAWPDVDYPEKVRPIVNGNGLLDARAIRLLRSLRSQPKDLDVVFVSNVLGGRERSVRIFQELARHDGPKVLLAVLPPGADPADDARIIDELEAAGVPWTRQTLPPRELWGLLSRAKVVPFRSGMHLCIPWRMLDLLAMGACVLFDAPPMPQWPVPLEPEVHYANAAIERDVERPSYDRIRMRLEALLASDEEAVALRTAAARYFDDHAAPERVAEYVLRTIAAR